MEVDFPRLRTINLFRDKNSLVSHVFTGGLHMFTFSLAYFFHQDHCDGLVGSEVRPTGVSFAVPAPVIPPATRIQGGARLYRLYHDDLNSQYMFSLEYTGIIRNSLRELSNQDLFCNQSYRQSMRQLLHILLLCRHFPTRRSGSGKS